jgi:hypothetical protein
MARQIIALAVCAALVSGCATAGGARMTVTPLDQAAAPRSASDQAVLSEYVQRLQPGIRVRVDRVNAKAVKGTLLKASATAVVIQPRTRVPEPPVEIPLAEVLAVTPEGSNGIGKAIGIGAAAGAAAALGVILILIAAFSD